MLPTLFAVFVIGSAFAYYDYKFSRFHFIDFAEHIFLTGSNGTVFVPESEAYIVVFYSSRQGDQRDDQDDLREILAHENIGTRPVLAIDLSQQFHAPHENVTHISAEINTLLPVLRRFNILHSPSVMLIVRENGSRYKQASRVEKR